MGNMSETQTVNKLCIASIFQTYFTTNQWVTSITALFSDVLKHTACILVVAILFFLEPVLARWAELMRANGKLV